MKRVLAKIKAFFEEVLFGSFSRTQEAAIVRRCGVDVAKGLQEQYEKTFFAALEGNAARNALGEFEQGGERYSLNENAATELHKALYDIGYRSDVRLRDVSPPIMLSQKGVRNLPMAMKASHIRENVFTEEKAINLGLPVNDRTHYHGLGETFFLQIIDELDFVTEAYRGTKNASNPARRENYFLLVSKFKDKEGNVINVPVYIDERADINRVFIDVNKISTVFGKTDFYNYVQRLIKSRELVRIKNRSTSTSERDAPIAPDYGRNASAISIAQKSEKSTPDAKKLLEDRVSGDELLNAQDLIADVQELGGQVDEYGYITLYHRTSADKAAAIRSAGEMVAKEDGLFFSTKIDGQNVGYGDTVVTFSIPAEKLLLDDVFDDEAHLRFPLKKPGRVSMKEYLVSEDTDDTGLHSDPEDDVKSDREILAGALLNLAQTDEERDILRGYQEQARALDKKSARLAEVRKELSELRFLVYQEDIEPGNQEVLHRGDGYRELRDARVKEKNRLEREIDKENRALIQMQALKPLKEFLIREKKRTKTYWKEKGEQALSEQRERQIRQAYCKGIESKAKNLLKKLRENTDKHHIPDAFKEPVAKFLSLLDFSSNRLLNDGKATIHDTELQEAFQLVRDMLTQSPNYVMAMDMDKAQTDGKEDDAKDKKEKTAYDPNQLESFLTELDLHPDTVASFVKLGSEIDKMVRGSDTFVLNRMSVEQLKELNSTLYALTRAIKQANELFATDHFQDATTAAQGMMQYCDGFKRHSDSTKILDFLEWDNLRPKAVFARFGKTGEALFQALWEAQDKFIRFAKEFEAFTKELYSEEESKNWLKTVHTFRSEKGSFSLTDTEIMSMYALWKSEDGRRHLLGNEKGEGGMTLKHSKDAKKQIKKQYKEDKQKKQYRDEIDSTTLTEELVKNILAKLTDRQKEVADKMQKFMSERGAEIGNEISLKRWGIKAYGMRDYFSIESDPDFMTQDQAKRQEGKDADMFAILFPGFRHKRNQHASNPIIVRDFFDVFAGHMINKAKYNAFSFALLDIRKIMNYREGGTSSVRNSMRRAFGDGAQKYIEQLLIDLNGDIGGRSATEGMAMTMASLHKIAAVGYNLRVGLLQVTAYVRLLNVMEPKYFFGGRAKNDGKFHIYDITNKIRDTADRMNGLERPVGNALTNGIPANSIAHPNDIVKRKEPRNSPVHKASAQRPKRHRGNSH